MRHRAPALLLFLVVGASACTDSSADELDDGDDVTGDTDVRDDATALAGDRCDDAQPVTLRGPTGATTLSAIIVADLADYGGDYAPRCSGQAELGDDRVYRVTLAPGERLDAKLSPSFPAALYFLGGPAATCTATCLAGEAVAANDQAFLSHANTTDAPEDVFVVVDALTALAGGREYRLALRTSVAP